MIAAGNPGWNMAVRPAHRKLVKHYHEPGDFHELTFSCYHRLRLLTNDAWRAYLSSSIDEACRNEGCLLLAFVFMPEHVHLPVYPTMENPDIDRLLAAIKRPCSAGVKRDLVQARSRLLERLTVKERPGKTCFRFWQEGPGYDRNLRTEKAVMESIDYLHRNPVRRGLCREPSQWTWSSARFYLSDGQIVDKRWPRVCFPPHELFLP